MCVCVCVCNKVYSIYIYIYIYIYILYVYIYIYTCTCIYIHVCYLYDFIRYLLEEDKDNNNTLVVQMGHYKKQLDFQDEKPQEQLLEHQLYMLQV